MSEQKSAAELQSKMARPASLEARSGEASSVVELRQYTLHPGACETLIGLFDGHFVEPQEEAGMIVIGQFRDLDRPDMFVWLRGFPNMERRKASLDKFYGGPVWAAHRDTANATMIDSDDVLLLRPAWLGAAFDLAGAKRPTLVAGTTETLSAIDTTRFAATIWHLKPEVEEDFVSHFEKSVVPLLASLGAPVLGAFVTEHAENTFPRLPVRTNENVFVALTRFSDAAAQQKHRNALAGSPEWRAFLEQAQGQLSKPVELLQLTPTARSLLR